ncbi:hypothetical protein CONLIGDRAFT_91180 [Coniochaeta ligniaria NRRL 30616]|uniref:Cora-domain-containing protein n=1 Tax=Coniochaeta ligniaria NRRL 30616 TaxID=1408157 RepID=A0A1J7J6D2_9PEZI|nr:hypothetical protein CONLIGDRAFT_91180 [Coniochaeta ligniaria NRRL 30616]
MEAFLRGLEDDSPNYVFPDDASNPNSFDVVESTLDGPLVQKCIASHHLIDWANDREDREAHETVVPTFKMVWFSTHMDTRDPLVSRSLWDAVLDAFHIGTWLKIMAFYKHRGFFQPRNDAMDDILAFVLCAGRGSTIWSYSPATGHTRTVSFGSSQHGADYSRRLVQYSSSVDHPLFPGFVYAVHSVFDCLHSLRTQRNGLDRLEVATGYINKGIVYKPTTDKGERPTSLSKLSKDAAAISNMINFLWMEIHILKQVFEMLVDYSSHPLATQLALWEDVAGVAHCMLQRIDSQERYDLFNTKRVANQMTIIFNLIAREDTAATIRLAEATKRDSSSMKTLAVMTMAFLPATFLASVFAMPSLAVDKPPRFGVYLAVTIPTTVAILLGWAAITQRQVIRDLLVDVRRRTVSTSLKRPKPDVEMVSMDVLS